MAVKFELVSPPPQTEETAAAPQFELVAPPQESDTPVTAAEAGVNMAVRAYNQFGDIAAGVNAGIVGVPQGVAELAGIGIDSAFGTNTLDKITGAFNWFKGKMGFTPTTQAGKSSEAMTNFASVAIPVAGWLNRASTVAKGGAVIPGTSRIARSAETFGRSKTGQALLKTRPRQAATTTVAMGLSDFLVAPDGTKTVSDAFDALPDALETEPDTGLYGREEAGRYFRNKARHFAEGSFLNSVFEVAFPVIGGTAKLLANTPGVSWAASTVNNGFDALIRSLDETVPDAFTENFKKYFLFSERVPRELKEKLSDANNIESALTNAAAQNFKMFDSELKKVFKGQRLFGRGRDGIRKGYSDLMKFLEGDPDALDPREYSPMVVKAAERMRTQIDEISDVIARQIENARNITDEDKIKLLAEFEENKGKYVRYVYEGALDPERALTAGTKENAVYRSAVQEVANLLRQTEAEELAQGTLQQGRTQEELLQSAERVVQQRVYGDLVDGGLDPIQAAKEFKKNVAAGKKASEAGPQPLFRIAENLLKDRLDIYESSPSLRKLKGIKDDPKEVYLQTIGDMSRLAASNDLYDEMAVSYMKTYDEAINQINSGRAGPQIISGENLTNAQRRRLEKELGYRPLGGENANSLFGGSFGSLSGAYVKPGVQDALTIPQRIFSEGPLGHLYSAALQSKGLSQMMKTVLNPLAITRNALSGIFMLGANGNVARSMNLWDSLRLTMGKVKDLNEDEFRLFYDKMGKLGIRDQNLVVNEFQRLLREGAKTPSYQGADAGVQKFINHIPGVRLLQDVYSGTDTFWKIAGVLAENGKYASALQKAGINPNQISSALEESLIQSGVAKRRAPLKSELEDISFMDTMTSDIVKATMPTYSRVPRVIKGIQRIPVFGNFVAFPAEIIRNSANIVSQGTKEMAFKASPALIRELGEQGAKRLEQEIRAIGAKRIMGYTVTATVLPKTVQEASMALTGATQEEMDALHRVVAPYMKGHTLFFIEKPKDGKAQYMDFSYMNPYDYAIDPARQALRIYNEKGELTDSEVSKIFSATLAGISSFMEPFASEALIAERVLDVTTRQGKSDTGGFIYRDQSDSTDDIIRKSITHVMGGFNPGILEQIYTTKGGEVKPGRFKRALEGTTSGQGVVSDPQEEILTMMTGFRRMDLDLPNQIKFLGFEYGKRRSSASSAFRNVVNANDTTREDVLEAYARENDNLRRIQGEFYQVLSAARDLGMSDEDIYRYFKAESKLGKQEIQAVMDNTFNPIKPTSSMAEVPFYESEIKQQPRVLKELPSEELFDLYEGYLDQKLTVEPRPQFNGFAPTPEIESPPQATAPQFELVPPPQATAPQFELVPPPQATAPPSQTSNQVSPILVPNPITRATVGSR